MTNHGTCVLVTAVILSRLVTEETILMQPVGLDPSKEAGVPTLVISYSPLFKVRQLHTRFCSLHRLAVGWDFCQA